MGAASDPIRTRTTAQPYTDAEIRERTAALRSRGLLGRPVTPPPSSGAVPIVAVPHHPVPVEFLGAASDTIPPEAPAIERLASAADALAGVACALEALAPDLDSETACREALTIVRGVRTAALATLALSARGAR